MNETLRQCPQCNAPLPPNAPQGLCPRCLLNAAAPPPEAIPGDIIDIGDAAEVAKALPQFEIIEMLGQGGMGVVYKARQIVLDRVVALKILPPADAFSPDFVERFRREARSLAKLNHPNIVNVYDFGETGGLYYIIMEFVDGANLRQLFQTRKLTSAEALAIVPKICDALQYAHEEGLVHRDIKPENLLIDKKGRVKIADFGLAKLLRREPLDMTLTLSGTALGTLRYMAPEQMDKPETVDHRADLYSLGVVIYEMLTGETPVGRYELPSQKAQVDVRFDEIVLHALEREPSRRYQHASEVKTDVENVTGKPSPQAITGRASEAPPSLQHTVALQSTADFRKEDAKGILRVVMAILVSLSAIGTAAGVVGFARVIVPAFRPDTIRGAVETLGRDAFQFIGILILSLMGLFLLPKAIRQGRDRLARVVAFDLVIMGAMLTLACEKQWFGPAVPYWVGGLVSIAAFACWIVLRGKDVRAVFTSPERPGGFEAAGEAGAPASSSEVTPSQPTRHLLSAALVLLCLFGFFFGLSFQAKTGGTAAGVTEIITVGALDPLFVREKGPSGFETGLNFFSWSFFAVVVGGIAFGAVWRIGREDRAKVPRDAAWWRGWWKQVGVWGGLLLIVCIVRTVMDPAKVLQLPGNRTVSAKYNKQLAPSIPPLGTITNGIGAQFTVPAGQVAIFEIVTRKDKATVPVPPHCAYVLAGEGPIAGTFRWSREPEQKDGPFRRWRIELVSEAGTGSTGGIALPEALDAVVGARGLGLGVLEPNEENVHWGTADVENLPTNGIVGLRVTTTAHNLKTGGESIATTEWKGAKTGPTSSSGKVEPPKQPFMIGLAGPELTNEAMKGLKLSKLQTDEINRIVMAYHRDYLALQRQHSTVGKDDAGRIVVTITPFYDECLALAKRLQTELGGIVDPALLPVVKDGELPFQIFNWGGAYNETITMWKTDGKYFVEEKLTSSQGHDRDPYTFNMSGPKLEEIPESFRIYWREE